jgi:drug/metabolite transporter, DME family
MTNNLITHEWQGYLLVIAAATLWGAAGTLAKYMMVQAISPMILAEMRVTVAAGILGLLLWRLDRRLLRLRRRDIVYMLVLGVVGVAGVNYTYYFAISKTNVATAILLQYTAPAFIMLFAVMFQGEALSAIKILALCVAFLGCFLVIGGYDMAIFATTRAGLIGGMGAAFCFAFYSLYAEHGMKTYPLWTILFYGFCAATGFWWCVQPPWSIVLAGYSWQTWLLFLCLGLFSTLIPFALYFTGIRCIRATRASITGMFEPVVAGVIAYVFLGETMELLQMLGGGFVLGGIGLLQMTREPAVQAEPPDPSPAAAHQQHEPSSLV